jgi:hypothetical protein
MWANITQIIVAIIAAVGVILSAILATGQQELKNSSAILASEQQALEDASVGSLEDGQKVCSVVDPNNWRDSMIVPKSWTAKQCQNYQEETRAVNHQLGCAFRDELVLGEQVGNLAQLAMPPARDCGWGSTFAQAWQ